jgi:lipoyl(octanoyl) transferase
VVLPRVFHFIAMMKAHQGNFRWILLLFIHLSAVVCHIPRGNKYVNVINLMDRYLPYSSAWDLQRDLMQHHIHLQDKMGSSLENIEKICVGTVILCQHSPTYTLGSATTEGSGPFSKKLADGAFLEYDTFTVERAGQATFHGPGQLVVYPILDLSYFGKDIHLYLRALEETIMDTLAVFDISSQRIEGTPLSIAVNIRHFITVI